MTFIPPQFEWNPCPSSSDATAVERAARVFFQSELSKPSSFEMHVIRMSDGKPLWTGQMSSGILDQIRLYDNRIVAVAGTHLYILSLDGEKTAHPRLPADTRRVCVSGDYVAAATRSGRLIVLSSRDGKMVWEQQIGGKASSLEIAADSLYVTARLPRAISDRLPDGTPLTPVPRNAAQQLLEEVTGQHRNGDPDDEVVDGLFPDSECRTLINFSLANGNERWRHQPLSGDLHLLPDGNCLLLDQGFGLATLFRSGGCTYLTEHLQKSGKEIWKCQIPDSVLSIKADAQSVYLLTRNSGVTSGKSSDAPGNNSALRAVRRRALINKVRKF
jgi:outer membrane protein assembly factor BamB